MKKNSYIQYNFWKYILVFLIPLIVWSVIYSDIDKLKYDEVINVLYIGDTLNAEELEKELEKYSDTSVYLCGDGYEIARKMLKNENIEDTPEALLKQNAYSVAVVALKEYEKGNATDDSTLSPTYLRVPQAERERLEKLQNQS